MDPNEVQLIERLIPRDAELRRLWEAHRGYEEQLARLNAQRFLTPEEEVLRKEIRKSKLAGKDRIHAILERHRSAGDAG
jgi:uncharacterized protein YdcH (DUF465 family)